MERFWEVAVVKSKEACIGEQKMTGQTSKMNGKGVRKHKIKQENTELIKTQNLSWQKTNVSI